MSSLRHFLLTRFNCGVYDGGQRDRFGEPIDGERWTAHRFRLFETCCLPSVRDQLCQRFTWLVVFDDRTPRPLRRRIRAQARRFPRLEPLFVDCRGRWSSRVLRDACRQHIARSLAERPCRTLLTTRLDSDDGLGRRAVGYLQGHATETSGRRVLGFSNGFRLCGGHLFRASSRSSPFLTLAEPVRGVSPRFVTVYERQHDGWGKIGDLQTDPMWLQVVHRYNLFNHVSRFDVQVAAAGLLEDFPRVAARLTRLGLTRRQLTLPSSGRPRKHRPSGLDPRRR